MAIIIKYLLLAPLVVLCILATIFLCCGCVYLTAEMINEMREMRKK